MSTTITQAIERSIEARSKEGGEVSRVMYSNMTTARGWLKRNDNEFTQNNVFGQLFWKQPLDEIELDSLAQILSWMEEGLLTACVIQVGETPGADKDEDGANQQALENLPDGFTGVWGGGGNADDDGYIEFHKPINLNLIIAGVEHRTTLSPDSIYYHAPLEVGYTLYSTSFWHLFESGMLARWPYDSEFIYLLHYSGKLAGEFVSYALDLGNA